MNFLYSPRRRKTYSVDKLRVSYAGTYSKQEMMYEYIILDVVITMCWVYQDFVSFANNEFFLWLTFW